MLSWRRSAFRPACADAAAFADRCWSAARGAASSWARSLACCCTSTEKHAARSLAVCSRKARIFSRRAASAAASSASLAFNAASFLRSSAEGPRSEPKSTPRGADLGTAAGGADALIAGAFVGAIPKRPEASNWVIHGCCSSCSMVRRRSGSLRSSISMKCCALVDDDQYLPKLGSWCSKRMARAGRERQLRRLR